jgi:cellulose synthase/poly-beta-1,6-N-acetylglucosamine synthase-like glycosyltransferase
MNYKKVSKVLVYKLPKPCTQKFLQVCPLCVIYLPTSRLCVILTIQNSSVQSVGNGCSSLHTVTKNRLQTSAVITKIEFLHFRELTRFHLRQCYGHVQISLLHQFPGMSILKIYTDAFNCVPMFFFFFFFFFLFTITSSVTWNLFPKIVIVFLI